MADPRLIALRLGTFAGQLGEVRLQAHRLEDTAAAEQEAQEERLASATSAATSARNRAEDSSASVARAEEMLAGSEQVLEELATRANLAEDATSGLARLTGSIRATWRARAQRARLEIARLEARIATAPVRERSAIQAALRRWRQLDACATDALAVCDRVDALRDRAKAQARGVREHGDMAREAHGRSTHAARVAAARSVEAEAAASEARKSIHEATEAVAAARRQLHRMGELAETVRARIGAADSSLEAAAHRLRAFDRGL